MEHEWCANIDKHTIAKFHKPLYSDSFAASVSKGVLRNASGAERWTDNLSVGRMLWRCAALCCGIKQAASRLRQVMLQGTTPKADNDSQRFPSTKFGLGYS